MRAMAFAAAVFVLAVPVGCASSGRAPAAGPDAARHRYEYVWQAASRLSGGCARRDQWWNFFHYSIFARGGADPLVYYSDSDADRGYVLSSRGDRFSNVGLNPPVLWPCRTPVAIHQTRQGWEMSLLARAPAQPRTIPLGGLPPSLLWKVAPNGRFLFWHDQTIQYAGERPFTLSGLPRGLKVYRLNPSPRDPAVFVANVVAPVPCAVRTVRFRAAHGIASVPTTTLRVWKNECVSDTGMGPYGVPTPEWTPDGRGLLWRAPIPGSDEAHVYLSDAHGRHFRKLLSSACREDMLFSPNGKDIAYQDTCTLASQSVYVLDLTSGARKFVAHGQLEAWSPDGSELALLQGYYCDEPGSILVVPAAGGTPRKVITWPPRRC